MRRAQVIPGSIWWRPAQMAMFEAITGRAEMFIRDAGP